MNEDNSSVPKPLFSPAPLFSANRISQPSGRLSCPWRRNMKQQTIEGTPWCPEMFPALHQQWDTNSIIWNISHSLPAFSSPYTSMTKTDTSFKTRGTCLHPSLASSMTQMAPICTGSIFWSPYWIQCTTISKNADLCSKPSCRQFPRHSLTVCLFCVSKEKKTAPA